MMYFDAFSMLEEEAMIGALTSLISLIPSSFLSLAVYIFSSLSLYTVAKRRGLNHPWLSWIPVGNLWILGSLSDQYRYLVKGQTKSKRKVLLILNIILYLLCAVFFIIFAMMIGGMIGAAMSGRDESQILRDMMGSVAGILCLVVPMMGVSIATAIIRYMALYDLYSSCDPQNKTIFLVVGILVNITEPVFLFLCRNKDYGMPPRRDIPQPAYTGSYSCNPAPGYTAPEYTPNYTPNYPPNYPPNEAPNYNPYPHAQPYQAPQQDQE